MKQTSKRNTLFAVLTIMVTAIAGGLYWRCNNTEEPRQLTAEEMRLEHAALIDSTLLRTPLPIDSIMVEQLYSGISAKAWILVDDSTGMIISQNNATDRMFPASLTKMMTCLLTLEHGNMGDSVEITPDVFVTRDSRVRPGDSYLLSNLMKEMMMVSDNVAAVALAKHIGGDTLSFANMMNQKAAYLGMDSTHFSNPNGMPSDSNYSSARDLLVLARYCMNDSSFAQIVGTQFVDIPLLDGRHMPCDNTNLMLQSYEGIIGIKTGFTRLAGACLASAATRGNTTLYLILLGSKNQTTRFTESAALLDYGFSVIKTYQEMQKLQ